MSPFDAYLPSYTVKMKPLNTGTEVYNTGPECKLHTPTLSTNPLLIIIAALGKECNPRLTYQRVRPGEPCGIWT